MIRQLLEWVRGLIGLPATLTEINVRLAALHVTVRAVRTGQETLMAKIDEAVDSVSTKFAAVETKLDEVVVTLQELKALVDGAEPTNAIQTLSQVGDRIDAALAKVTAAEDATDPTPDNPPPPEPTPGTEGQAPPA